MIGRLGGEDEAVGVRAELSGQAQVLWRGEAAELHERAARAGEEGMQRSSTRRRRQLACLRRRIHRAHQRLADENRIGAKRSRSRRAQSIHDAALRDENPVAGDERTQLSHDVGVHGEGAQIAAIDADHLRACRHRAPRLVRVVRLHQRLHAQRMGEREELRKLRIVEQRADQQQRIGARRRAPRRPDMDRR